jgi:hypothetical protein
MISHGTAPFLECSTRGDVRFSALRARVRARGNRRIEDIYQSAKIFADGTSGLSSAAAKGRLAVNQAEVRTLYAQLWDEYVAENPSLLEVLKSATGLQDRFGQDGHACQATELWRIRCVALGVSYDHVEVRQGPAPRTGDLFADLPPPPLPARR